MAQTLPSVLGSAALLFSGSPEVGASGFQLKSNRESGVKPSNNGRTVDITATSEVFDRLGI